MAIQHVQTPSASAKYVTVVTSVTETFLSNTINGNFILVHFVVFKSGGPVPSITSVTDNFGNTYTLAASTSNSDRNGYIYFAKNVSGGASHTVTVTFGSTADSATIAISEYSGIEKVSPLCQIGGAITGTSTTPTARKLNGGGITNLYVGLLVPYSSPTITEAFTLRAERETHLGLCVQDTIGTGPITLTWTYSVSNFWNVCCAVFRSDEPGPQRIQDAVYSDDLLLTSKSVTLLSPVAAGNLILAAVAIDKNSGTITVPSGFTLIQDSVNTSVSSAFAYKIATGGEQTITWNWVTAHLATVWAGEYTGTKTVAPVIDQSAENSTETVVTSLSAGTTPSTAVDSELAVAMMAADTGTSVDAGRAWSNSFTEINFDIGTGSGAPGLFMAEKYLTSAGAQSSTYSTTDIGDQMSGAIATFFWNVNEVNLERFPVRGLCRGVGIR